MTYAVWARSRFGGTTICIACTNDLQIATKLRDEWLKANPRWTCTMDQYEEA